MKTGEETTLILTKFYGECVTYWKNEGKDKDEAKSLAIKDVESITTDPFSPTGAALNDESKQQFLAQH